MAKRSTRYSAPTTKAVELFTTPSGLGGSFTVSVVRMLEDGRALVRVHYPTKEWDGYRFEREVSRLVPTGRRGTVELAEAA